MTSGFSLLRNYNYVLWLTVFLRESILIGHIVFPGMFLLEQMKMEWKFDRKKKEIIICDTLWPTFSCTTVMYNCFVFSCLILLSSNLHLTNSLHLNLELELELLLKLGGEQTIQAYSLRACIQYSIQKGLWYVFIVFIFLSIPFFPHNITPASFLIFCNWSPISLVIKCF